ncbi:MAG: sulfatase [Planctomycetota bacterium]
MNRLPALDSPVALAAVLLVAAAYLLGSIEEPGSPVRGGALQVILISLDTLRQDHLSLYGYPRPTTPNLERLAKRSAVFTNAMAQAPYTLPSHMSMLTGLYPGAHNVRLYEDTLDESFVTLAETLRDAGFRTQAFTDGGFMNGRFGFAQGFESYEDRRAPGGQQSNGFRRYGLQVRRWVVENRDEPFFLFVHSFDNHGPYFVEPEYQRALASTRPVLPEGAKKVGDPMEYMRALGIHDYFQLEQYDSLEEMVDHYDATIRYVDDKVGELVGLLNSLDLFDSSLIIVTSDHGEAFLDHGIYTGHGLTLYEEEVRVPLLIKFPGGQFAGVRSDAVVRLIDLFPTVTSATRTHCPREVQGVDLALALAGRDRESRVAFGENPHLSRTEEGRIVEPSCYVRRGDRKYIDPPLRDLLFHLDEPAAGEEAYDWERDPLGLMGRLPTEPEVYDLAADSGEQHPKRPLDPRVLKRLRWLLKARLERDGLILRSHGDRSAGNRALSDEEIKVLMQQGYLGGELPRKQDH